MLLANTIHSQPPAKRARFAQEESSSVARFSIAGQTAPSLLTSALDGLEEEEEEEEDELAATQTVMSVLIRNGQVGCAVFDGDSKTLYLLEDAAIEASGSAFRYETVISANDESASAPARLHDLLLLSGPFDVEQDDSETC